MADEPTRIVRKVTYSIEDFGQNLGVQGLRRSIGYLINNVGDLQTAATQILPGFSNVERGLETVTTVVGAASVLGGLVSRKLSGNLAKLTAVGSLLQGAYHAFVIDNGEQLRLAINNPIYAIPYALAAWALWLGGREAAASTTMTEKKE